MVGERAASLDTVLMQLTLWLPRRVADEIVAEADLWYDLETGGTFMGYWAGDRDVVVTSNIAAGPEATHERFRFEPDQEWQQNEIDLRYEGSGRLDNYLGDWHTHPNTTAAGLSWTDRSCARRVIETRAARQVRPVMLLLIGRPADWSFNPYVCTMRKKWGFFSMLDTQMAQVRIASV